MRTHCCFFEQSIGRHFTNRRSYGSLWVTLTNNLFTGWIKRIVFGLSITLYHYNPSLVLGKLTHFLWRLLAGRKNGNWGMDKRVTCVTLNRAWLQQALYCDPWVGLLLYTLTGRLLVTRPVPGTSPLSPPAVAHPPVSAAPRPPPPPPFTVYHCTFLLTRPDSPPIPI